MRNGDLPQGMYTRIPQHNIDSESEEEFRLHMNNCQLKGSQIVARNSKSSNMQTTISRLPESLPDVRLAQSHYSSHSRMPSDADNVAIFNAHLRKTQPMSKGRKAIFIVSIFVCIFTVIFFVWILPCSDRNSCPAKSERIHTHSWLRNYERVELKGTINVVPGIRGRSKNLVFMYRRNNFFKNDFISGGTSKQNGIISLIGSSGQVCIDTADKKV